VGEKNLKKKFAILFFWEKFVKPFQHHKIGGEFFIYYYLKKKTLVELVYSKG
jgi:hypothetical protein